MTNNDTSEETADTESLVKSHWFEGVYFDEGYDQFVQIARHTEADGTVVLLSMEETELERVSPQDWEKTKDRLLSVPHKAVEEPVKVIEGMIKVNIVEGGRVNVGAMYADEVTEVVKRD